MKKLVAMLVCVVTILAMATTHADAATYKMRSDYTKAEIELMARVVYSEARSESWNGKLAVAAVVLNRIETSGSSVRTVVYAPNQFAVGRKTNSTCRKAVKYLIKNKIRPLPTNTKYFKTSSGRWRSFTRYCKIGHHYFFMSGSKPIWNKESPYRFNKSGKLVKVKTSTTSIKRVYWTI